MIPTIQVNGTFLDPDLFSEHYPQSKFQEGDPEEEPSSAREALLDALKWTYQQWDEARKPHLAEARKAWDRYLNRWDFSKKADWQSQRRLAKFTMAVERLTAVISRLLTLSKEWFTLRAMTPRKAGWITFAKKWVRFMLEHPRVSFKKLFKQSLKTALLAHFMATMITWEIGGYPNPDMPKKPEQTAGFLDNVPMTPFTPAGGASKDAFGQLEQFMRLENLNPFKVLLDPSGRRRGLIIERTYTRAEYRMEAEARTWLNTEAVLESEYAGAEEDNADEADRKDQPSESIPDNIKIWECWFDHLSDERGDLAIPTRNFYCVIANEEHIAVPPTPNPFWHGEIPVITASLIDIPWSVYHVSPMGLALDPIELWVDFMNLCIDHFHQAMIGVKEINMSILHPDEEQEGLLNLFPGRALKKNGDGQLIANMQPGETPQALPFFIQWLNTEMGEYSALRDAGTQGALPRARMSGQEFQMRAADAGTLLDSWFETLETDWIVPVLTLCYKTSLQFTPDDVWAEFLQQYMEQLPDEAPKMKPLLEMSAEERYKLLANDLAFECRAFSAIFDRQQEVEKGTFLMGVAGRIPMGQAHIKWGNLLGKVVENIGWDKEETISMEPIVPYSEILGGKPLGGGQGQHSDGGEETPQQPPSGNQMQGQSQGSLGGGLGNMNKEMVSMMPGTKR